jgi:four helix bundle protein
MARPKDYRELIVWQKAMALARSAYVLSHGPPKTEAYGLSAQIRRAAISVPSNIAEGHGRLTDLQFRHFLGNARGSLYEMQTQLELAAGLDYLDKDEVWKLMEQGAEVARLINGLLASMGKAVRTGDSATNSANPASTANSAHKGNSR